MHTSPTIEYPFPFILYDGDAPTGDWRYARGGLLPWQCRKVVSFVENHLEGPIFISQLAAEARLCKSHFSRAFKISFAMTPHRYVMNRRLMTACRMMGDSRASLSEIAAACGLTDQSHLSNLFRRMHGVSPNHWRRWAFN